MGLHAQTLRRILATVVAAGLTISLSACQWRSSAPTATSTPKPTAGPIAVVASVSQWGSLAKQIGGDDVNVTTIITSTTANPHEFEPKASDIAKLQKATILVSNGAGYDSWAAKNGAKGTQTISAADIVGALEGDNPHLWFSKDARKGMASELADAFSKERPAKKKAFAARLKQWDDEENTLEKAMKTFGADHKAPTYAATDAVTYYLMAEMGFKELTPRGYAQAAASSMEPGTADMDNFQRLLEQCKVDVLIANAQVPSVAATTLIQSAQQNKVPVLNVTEQLPQDDKDLVSWIADIVDRLSTDIPSDTVAKHERESPSSSPSATTTDSATPSPSTSSKD